MIAMDEEEERNESYGLLLSQFLRKENRHKCPGILEMELSKKDLYFQIYHLLATLQVVCAC